MEQNERAYWTKEVAERLNIGHSTLRKYCIALETKADYEFTKGQRGVRAFLEQDIKVLERMRDVLNEPGTTMDEAVSLALGEREDGPLHVVPSFDTKGEERENDSLQVVLTPQVARQLLEMFREELLDEVRREVVESLQEQEVRAISREEEQEKRMIAREEEREKRTAERESERDKHLMELIRDTQETKRMIAAAAEGKKSWLQRLFSQKK